MSTDYHSSKKFWISVNYEQHFKKYPFTELQGKLPCSEKPPSNSCHESNTSYPNLPFKFIVMDFFIILKSVWGSIFSIMTRTYPGKYGFKNLGTSKTTTSFPKYPHQLQGPPSLQINENQSFLSGHKVARADSLTTHTHLHPSFKIGGAIPPLNQPAPMAHNGTTLFYLYLLPTYISLKR